MSNIPLSDKGWLRQYLPRPTHDQLYRFIEGVGKRLDHVVTPTSEQTEHARQGSLADLLGTAA